MEVVETVRRGWSGGTKYKHREWLSKRVEAIFKTDKCFTAKFHSNTPRVAAYLAPPDWLWWCQSLECSSRCRCSTQNPLLWQNVSQACRWTGSAAGCPLSLEWQCPHWTSRNRFIWFQNNLSAYKMLYLFGGVIYLSLVHLIVGAGSPTELQGRRTSFIHGVVTVPPKDRIFAGTAHIKQKCH